MNYPNGKAVQTLFNADESWKLRMPDVFATNLLEKCLDTSDCTPALLARAAGSGRVVGPVEDADFIQHVRLI
jgi:hypothetical protein